jgi:decaprenylphospho-beta-D-ribofuranose 2-oxidase
MLPVTPGTLQITVGGAIAADIHGKNQHRDGDFGDFVQELTLLTADGQARRCSPEENAELFAATIGGMGLTGIIAEAVLRLVRVPSAYVTATWRRAGCLDEALSHMADADREDPFSVAWIDCLAGGASLGRSVVMRARYAQVDELPAKLCDRPLEHPRPRRKTVPGWFPGWMLNHTTVKWFNALFYRRHGDRTAVVAHDGFFYPLDAMDHWNRMYGKAGFVQFQSVVPREGARQAMVEQLEALAGSGRGSFLAVLKSFGRNGRGMLSFPMPGLTLAIDLPNRPGLDELLGRLNAIVVKNGGRLYFAKDACAPAALIQGMYPRLEEFRRVKQMVDPKGIFQSTLSRRLGIVGGT